ncbi:MAG: MFS transporter, partial [Aquincola tertiaricarbonis]
MFPSTEEPKPRTATVLRLGSAQTLAWASTYYLPAILAAPMARDLGTTVPTVLAAFSLALVVSAAVGPRAGHAIDRLGGRPVLMATSGVFAAGLVGLGLCQGLAGLFMAWVVLGLGMGSGLYEAAFASLVRLYGRQARNGITGITLIAGFASTVGWPLSAWLE